MNLNPIIKQKISDVVADELERMIITNSLKENDELPSERELMASFQVGRPSIREALQRLSQKGLVKIKSGEKTRVTKPSVDTVIFNISGLAVELLSQSNKKNEFEKIRQLFEISIVREVANIRTDDDIIRIEAALIENRKSIGDYDRFVETDVAFHIAIIKSINNETLNSLYTAFIDWLIKARSTDNFIELHKRGYDHHCKILDAIKERKSDLAETHMSDHLKFVMEMTQ